jgi:hypothetical protein
MKFMDKIKEFGLQLMETRRSFLTREEVKKTFRDCLAAIGPYWEKQNWDQLADDDKGPNLSTLDNKGIIEREVVRIFSDEACGAGVNKIYRDSLKKDGYGLLVDILDKHDLWRDFEDTP